ncbi:MAG: hypothetical protein JSR45_07995 [Proteobacteria bacterium]|nr:hypothetical protein [Pseudomonadota bacterium]
MKLFEIRMKVAPGPDAPPGVTETFACCFASAADYGQAVGNALGYARDSGVEVLDVLSPVRELEPERWGEYVAVTWPEYAANLPTQAEIGALVESQSLFFSPFVAL